MAHLLTRVISSNTRLCRIAAYGTLLREPRRALHARIAETLERQFPDIAENQPDLLARHCTDAGLIEKAASLWGKAGQRSLSRSALVEAATQFARALDQIATLPATPALRREQIKLQVALITPLMHTKGYSAPETKAAAERARLLVELAETQGEPLEDPLLLFSALYGFWYANLVAFNGDVVCDLAAQFLTLAEKRRSTIPLMIGHRLVGSASAYTGDVADARAHYDQALALYDATKHRFLATRFGQDIRVMVLSMRCTALWILGYPEAALADVDLAVKDAREIGHAASLMYALAMTLFVPLLVGNYAAVTAQADELVAVAEEKSAAFWKVWGRLFQGHVSALTGRASDAVHQITSTNIAYKSTGATLGLTAWLSYLAKAHADVRQFEDAWRCIDEAFAVVNRTRERWWEAELNRSAGEIALTEPVPNATKAEAHFERALAVARQQQAKSWELRAAMSLARLWRDQGKVQQARELLAPVYGWFLRGSTRAI
jgi:predicted ATPase